MSHFKRRALVVVLAAALLFPACSLWQEEQESPSSTRSTLRAGCSLPLEHVRRIKRGYYEERAPDLTMIPHHPHYFGDFSWTSHSGPWKYLQEVPVVLYGPDWIESQGPIRLDREVTVADIAPTLARVLDVPFPADRPGKVIDEALKQPGIDHEPPRAIVVVVWDGAGINVLDQWPGTWPTLRGLAEQGTSIVGATVGSSPSVTPATHATIGTGAFPNKHGIVAPKQRSEEQIEDSFEDLTPDKLLLPTLAELYDEQEANTPTVAMFGEKGWLLGMIGQGAYRDSGDEDIAVLMEHGRLVSNDDWYSLPSYLDDLPDIEIDVKRVDARDGTQDDAWLGHAMEETLDIIYSPVWSFYQNRVIQKILDEEGMGGGPATDLFYVNYKALDHVGHRYNMVNPEMETTMEITDEALGELVAMLDEKVGEGEWLMVMTADHGQTPDAGTTGAWPILIGELKRDISRHFDVDGSRLIVEERPLSFWLDHEYMAAEGVTEKEISQFLLGYTIGQNVRESLPDGYEGREEEPLFEAAFPSRDIPKIWQCAKRAAKKGGETGD